MSIKNECSRLNLFFSYHQLEQPSAYYNSCECSISIVYYALLELSSCVYLLVGSGWVYVWRLCEAGQMSLCLCFLLLLLRCLRYASFYKIAPLYLLWQRDGYNIKQAQFVNNNIYSKNTKIKRKKEKQTKN